MPNLFIISGPSGAGEDSIIEGLKKFIDIERVITTTTRAMRPGESQGNPYYFISSEEFKKSIKENKFFEYACEYNNNYYGVTHEEINRVKNNGKVGIWKIEYKGVITAKKLMPDIVAIFINAPLESLEKRIKQREKQGVSPNYVKERMEYTKEWLKHKDIYDYEVINKDGELDKAIKETLEIIQKKYKKIKMQKQ